MRLSLCPDVDVDGCLFTGLQVEAEEGDREVWSAWLQFVQDEWGNGNLRYLSERLGESLQAKLGPPICLDQGHKRGYIVVLPDKSVSIIGPLDPYMYTTRTADSLPYPLPPLVLTLPYAPPAPTVPSRVLEGRLHRRRLARKRKESD